MDSARDLERDRRQDPRAELHVDLVYDSFSAFLSAAGGNLSRGGMFLAVPRPAAAGTRLSFEARLLDGSSLIRGEGEVVWTRSEVTAGLPVGMAIRFTRLSPQGRDLIARLIEPHREGRRAAVRLGGVRLGRTRETAQPSRTPVEQPLPLEEPAAPPARSPAPTATGAVPEVPDGPVPVVRAAPERDPEAATDGPQTRHSRVTDEGGSEFDFTLPPWETESVPRELRPPNPVRSTLIVAAILLVGLAVLYLGPRHLIAVAGQIGAAVSRRVLPDAPTPATHTDTPPTGAPAEASTRTSSRQGSSEAGESSPASTDVATGLLAVERVSWRRDAGGVVVAVQADRIIPHDAVHSTSMNGPPRQVVRIVGVDRYLGSATLQVGRHDLVRVRSGLHRDLSPSELHIVLDLGTSAVTVELSGTGTKRLEIRVRSGST